MSVVVNHLLIQRPGRVGILVDDEAAAHVDTVWLEFLGFEVTEVPALVGPHGPIVDPTDLTCENATEPGS